MKASVLLSRVSVGNLARMRQTEKRENFIHLLHYQKNNLDQHSTHPGTQLGSFSSKMYPAVVFS